MNRAILLVFLPAFLTACYSPGPEMRCRNTRSLQSFSVADLGCRGGPMSVASASASNKEGCCLHVTLRNDSQKTIRSINVFLGNSREYADGTGEGGIVGAVGLYRDIMPEWKPGTTTVVDVPCDTYTIECRDYKNTIIIEGTTFENGTVWKEP